MLILQSATLLNSLISSSRFCVESLYSLISSSSSRVESFVQNLYHLYKMINLPLLYQFGYLLFLLSDCCFLNFQHCVEEEWWESIFILFQILGGLFSAFHHWVLHLLWICQIAFIMLRYVLSIPTLVRIYITNMCWILENTFFASLSFLLLV